MFLAANTHFTTPNASSGKCVSDQIDRNGSLLTSNYCSIEKKAGSVGFFCLKTQSKNALVLELAVVVHVLHNIIIIYTDPQIRVRI